MLCIIPFLSVYFNARQITFWIHAVWSTLRMYGFVCLSYFKTQQITCDLLWQLFIQLLSQMYDNEWIIYNNILYFTYFIIFLCPTSKCLYNWYYSISIFIICLFPICFLYSCYSCETVKSAMKINLKWMAHCKPETHKCSLLRQKNTGQHVWGHKWHLFCPDLIFIILKMCIRWNDELQYVMWNNNMNLIFILKQH